MAHHFTCGEKKIWQNITKSQNIMKMIVGHKHIRELEPSSLTNKLQVNCGSVLGGREEWHSIRFLNIKPKC